MDEGDQSAIIGRNGAGKTTTIKAIMGLARASGGSITFDGESLIGLQLTRLHTRDSVTYPTSGSSHGARKPRDRRSLV